jgi:alpha-N-arabinofuranosidase
VKSGNYDVVDDHYYKTPSAMFALATKYDATPRTGEKVFVGEWATRSGAVTPNFGDALGDAAFMTGLERNSDVVVMAAYAPLLVNVNPGGMQWPTDLIGFDAEKSFGSPSYWAQVMFATRLGDSVVKSELSGAGDRFFVSATRGGKTLYLKLVNASDRAQVVALDVEGATAGMAKVTSLHAASYQATNSLERPEAIKPLYSSMKLSKSVTVPALTIEVLEIPLR